MRRAAVSLRMERAGFFSLCSQRLGYVDGSRAVIARYMARTRRSEEEAMDAASRAVHAFVSVGTARLPRMVSGDPPCVLMIEFSLDAEAGRIVDVATTIPLPGYAALLRLLLIGRRPAGGGGRGGRG